MNWVSISKLDHRSVAVTRVRLHHIAVIIVLLLLADCTPHQNTSSQSPAFPDQNLAFYLDQAIQALKQEMPEQALVLTDSALAYAPGHSYTYFVRGQAYYVLERYDEARTAWDQTLALEPGNWAWWQSIGDVAFQQQDFPASLAHYRRAAEMHPDPISWHGMAGAYWEMGFADSARIACRQALAIDASYAPAYASLADLAEEEGDFSAALQNAQDALRLVPENHYYRYVLGLMLLKNGRGTEAANTLRVLLTIRPQDVSVLHNMGRALVLTGHKMEAIYYFTKADSLRKEMK